MTLPTTVELCARIRDGHPCLGLIFRPQADVIYCPSCGGKEPGVVYHLPLRWLVFVGDGTTPTAAFEYADAAREWAERNYRGRARLVDAYPVTKD